MPILRLPTDLRARCTAIARASLPNEACGLLAGRRLGADIVLTNVHPVRNALASPTRFELDGLDMIAAEGKIDEAGADLVGVLHSHPTSQAIPSARDLADASAYDPGHVFVQLIVSLQGFAPVVRAFRYGDTATQTVEFTLESYDVP